MTRLAYIPDPESSGYVSFEVDTETPSHYISMTGKRYPKAQCYSEDAAKAFLMADEITSNQAN